MIFLFQTSWISFKVRFINTLNSHGSRWQYLEFKHSREVFELGTILSVVDFAKNYTFAPQREIQSEYYHSDQVSIFVHVLYRHAQESIDGRDSTPQSCDVIKEYHFMSVMIVSMTRCLFNIALS